MSKFWDRALECEHKSKSADYNQHVSCPTPLCSGDEEHCLDCGAYIVTCKCGYLSGLSGWPHKRWAAQEDAAT